MKIEMGIGWKPDPKEGGWVSCNPGDYVTEIERLKKENKKLRDALGPFACLGRNELTSGDFNRARRAIRSPQQGEQHE